MIRYLQNQKQIYNRYNQKIILKDIVDKSYLKIVSVFNSMELILRSLG